jgi:WD40 repeat protein
MLMLRRVLVVLVGVLALGVLGAPVAFAEEGCPNEAVRQAESAAHPEGFATQLPDCRAYEQVTPVDKDGTNPSGDLNEVEASPSGERILFLVLANMPGGSGGDFVPFFIGSRGGEGWSDQGLQAPRGPYGHSQIFAWSDDLLETVLDVAESTPSSEGGSVYLRDSASGLFQPAFPFPGQFSTLYVAGFSADDSRMFFETTAQLLPSAAVGAYNLYEWHTGTLSLVGVLPDGSTPPGGSSAGPEVSGERHDVVEGAVSHDGSRVFFTARGTEHIYVREDGTRTVAVGTGVFLGAASDGSKVFYMAGGDLFEFDVESEQAKNLTPDGGVEGLLGMSEDGSYVYFAANGGVIYVWHNGTTGLIAASSDAHNWSLGSGTGLGPKVSRVSSDGRFLLFTGSDGQLHRYDAVHDRLACVSCTSSGTLPADPATLQSISTGFLGHILTERAILLRNLSGDGSRVFFESSAALLPRDTNGVQDVYEWEQQGVGSCQSSSETFSAASGGCLYLISSGTSSEPSYFADASASGDDVFFFTFQPLVGQDQDDNVDIYDARVGGGFAAQSPPPAPVACEGEGCRPVAGGAPVFGAPVSATFTGAGNLATAPAPVVATSKPKPKAKHKILKRKRRRHKGKKADRGARGAGVRVAMRGGK